MGANLQDVFLKAMAMAVTAFGLLCLLKYVFKAVPRFWGAAFRTGFDFLIWAVLQIMLNLAFLASYVFYVKNGADIKLADLGVAFIAVSAVGFYLAWRLGALERGIVTLLPAAVYGGFLLYRFFVAGTGLGFFGYVVYNPMFAFIGSGIRSEKPALAALSALLPLACSAIGRGLAVKSIDKS